MSLLRSTTLHLATINHSSPVDPQLPMRSNSDCHQVASSHKLNPLSLHPLILTFSSPDGPRTPTTIDDPRSPINPDSRRAPMRINDPRSPMKIDTGCHKAFISSNHRDSEYEILQDEELLADDLHSSVTITPTSALLTLPKSNLSFEEFEARGFLPQGRLHVCNPDLSPSEATALLRSPPAEPVMGIVRRGALRFAKPRDPEFDTSVPAVTFAQILQRAESFPPRPRSRSPKPRKRRAVLERALVRAKIALAGKK